MKKNSLSSVLNSWESNDLANLYSLLGGKSNKPTIANIEEQFKWLYHSKTRAETETFLRNSFEFINSKIKKVSPKTVVKDSLRELPTYDQLLVSSAKHMKAYEGDPTLQECELYLAHSIIIGALHRMSPKERIKVFENEFSINEMIKSSKIKSNTVDGPASVFAVLGAAQASGFGVYVASTTALGFMTHAVGLTLPFAIYTGLTSSIAFIIGPIGWLSAGLWGVWELTNPKWKKIIPALMYISSINSYRKLI